eukprot:5338934-Pleurochrysis_carterae.AAC.3
MGRAQLSREAGWSGLRRCLTAGRSVGLSCGELHAMLWMKPKFKARQGACRSQSEQGGKGRERAEGRRVEAFCGRAAVPHHARIDARLRRPSSTCHPDLRSTSKVAARSVHGTSEGSALGRGAYCEAARGGGSGHGPEHFSLPVLDTSALPRNG